MQRDGLHPLTGRHLQRFTPLHAELNLRYCCPWAVESASCGIKMVLSSESSEWRLREEP
jgi:hypothetical protein